MNRSLYVLLLVVASSVTESIKTSAQISLQPPAIYTQTVLLREEASLKAIAFAPDDSTGIAVGEHGTILRSIDGGASWAIQQSSVASGLFDVIWTSNQNVVVVGGQFDRITQMGRAVVLFSNDAGHSWKRGNDEELPFLHSLSLRKEDHALIAKGHWSSIVLSSEFESHDGGQTWGSTGELGGEPLIEPESKSAIRSAWVSATGAQAVIRDVVERANSEIFAVGDHGAILHRDRASGRWKTIRGESRHALVLIVARDPSSVPWPLVGSESLEFHSRVAILLESPNTVSTSNADSEKWLYLARQAASSLGATSVDTIDSSEAIPSEAKNWLAIHRPTVVVIDQSLRDATSTAFAQAAVSSGATRVIRYGVGSVGEMSVHGGAMLPSAGVLASDLWNDSIQLVAPERQVAEAISLRVMYDVSGEPMRGESVTSGLTISDSEKLSASFIPANRRQLQIVQARMSEAKRVEQLIRTSPTEAFFTHSLKTILDQTAQDDQFRLAWLIQSKLASLSSETFPDSILFQQAALGEFARRFADHSMGEWCSLRADSMRNSEEWKRLKKVTPSGRVENSSGSIHQVSHVAISPFEVQGSSQDSTGVQQASSLSPIRVAEPTHIEIGAKPVAPRSSEIDLAWEFHPLVLIANEAARQRGDNLDASSNHSLEEVGRVSSNLERLLESESSNPWTDLLRGRGTCGLFATKVDSRPKLDGEDDEACWAGAGNDSGFRIAYDDEFVYLFAKYPSSLLKREAETESTERKRDYDLRMSDRLRISIDVDMDLMTAYRLETTASGKTHDSVDGQSEWQPTWYVATKNRDEYLQFEIAILRRDLTDLPLYPGQHWFVSFETIPSGKPSATPPIPKPSDWKNVTLR